MPAGLPLDVCGVTLDRMCGSGQQALHFAAQAILAGDMEVVLAGGTEMMSHQPLGSDYPAAWPADFPYELVHQGISAERMAEKWDLSREELDDWSYGSHLRAMRAIEAGWPQREIAASAYRHQQEVDRGERTIVGVNRYLAGEGAPIPTLRIDHTPERDQIAAVQALRARRNDAKARAEIETVRRACRHDGNLMQAVVEAARADVTLGEICQVFRDELGEYRDPAEV